MVLVVVLTAIFTLDLLWLTPMTLLLLDMIVFMILMVYSRSTVLVVMLMRIMMK